MKLLSAGANPADPKEVVVTIAAVATGGGELVLVLDGIESRYTTIAAESAADAATNWAAQMATDFAAIPAGTFTPVGAAIEIASAADLFVDYWFSDDATQTISVASYTENGTYLRFDTNTGDGLPVGPKGGFPCLRGTQPDDTAGAVTHVQVQLINFSGAAKTAKWSFWIFDPALGWQREPSASHLVLSAGAADEAVSTRIAVAARATRVAVGLEGDAATGANLANCAFSAWMAQ